MDYERMKEKINELRKSFFEREKSKITPEDLTKINMQEIKAWAWCTGMGSDAYILFVKNDGTILDYDHSKYSNDFDKFAQIEKMFLSQTEEWSLYRWRFINHLYIRTIDKEWLDHCREIFILANDNPIICIECICQKILGILA